MKSVSRLGVISQATVLKLNAPAVDWFVDDLQLLARFLVPPANWDQIICLSKFPRQTTANFDPSVSNFVVTFQTNLFIHRSFKNIRIPLLLTAVSWIWICRWKTSYFEMNSKIADKKLNYLIQIIKNNLCSRNTLHSFNQFTVFYS